MLRYYMTPETQQALIAESNRQIANRAAMHAGRGQRQGTTLPMSTQAPRSAANDEDGATAESESAFAHLMSDLRANARRA